MKLKTLAGWAAVTLYSALGLMYPSASAVHLANAAFRWVPAAAGGLSRLLAVI